MSMEWTCISYWIFNSYLYIYIYTYIHISVYMISWYQSFTAYTECSDAVCICILYKFVSIINLYILQYINLIYSELDIGIFGMQKTWRHLRTKHVNKTDNVDCKTLEKSVCHWRSLDQVLSLWGWYCLWPHCDCSRDEEILTLSLTIQKVVRTWPQHSGLPWYGHDWRPSCKLEADLHHRILLTVQTWFGSKQTARLRIPSRSNSQLWTTLL